MIHDMPPKNLQPNLTCEICNEHSSSDRYVDYCVSCKITICQWCCGNQLGKCRECGKVFCGRGQQCCNDFGKNCHLNRGKTCGCDDDVPVTVECGAGGCWGSPSSTCWQCYSSWLHSKGLHVDANLIPNILLKESLDKGYITQAEYDENVN